jgi:toluene monooxygenase system ferredoxin subunit
MKERAMTIFKKICSDDDLWEGEMVGYEVDGKKVLLLRHDGKVCAYADRCPHLAARLSEGTLENGTLTCAAHHWMFAAATGEGVNPRGICLTRYEVRIDNHEIWVGYEQ